MSKIIPSSELIGKVYGQLTIIEDLGVIQIKSAKRHCVRVRCSCGNSKVIFLSTLMKTKNPTLSCGCLLRKITADRNRKHDLCGHPLYYIWAGMIDRCYNHNARQYDDWGGRGIFVCDKWRHDFKAFYEWALSLGWQKGLDLDRQNNNDGYSPYNCRFVVRAVSNRNKRNNVYISYNGENKTLVEWSEVLGIPYKRLHSRVRILNWPTEKAFSTP